MLLLSELESADLVSLVSVCEAVGTEKQCLCEPSFIKNRRTNGCLVENVKNELRVSDFAVQTT
jgi:hypothetical protein